RSGNRILVQYADERSIAQDQISKTRELVALGLNLQMLLQDLRNPARYYWEISCALHLALLAENDDATKPMQAPAKKIRELGASRGRAQYLLSALSAAATAVAFTIPSVIWLSFKHQSLEGAFNWNFLLLAIAAGAIGAQFSMALSIPRLEQFDNEWTANVEGVLRILVGSIAAALLWLVLDSGLIQVAGLKVTTWQYSLVIGFLGGFSERLVPHLLVMRVNPPDLDRRSARQVGDLDDTIARLEDRIGALQ